MDDTKSINEQFENFLILFASAVNAHAPLRTRSRKEQKLQKKPWLSSALLKPIKIKNKIYANVQQKYDEQQIYFLLMIQKRFKQSLEKAEQNYNNNVIISIQNGPRKIWKIIHDLAQCFSTCGMRIIRSTPRVSGGTRVAFIIFICTKAWIISFLVCCLSGLFLINKFCASLRFLLFRYTSIFMHIKQCQIMSQKPNNNFCTKLNVYKIEKFDVLCGRLLGNHNDFLVVFLKYHK